MVCSKWKSTNITKASGSSKGLRILARGQYSPDLATGTLVNWFDSYGMPPGLKSKFMHAPTCLLTAAKRSRLLERKSKPANTVHHMLAEDDGP